MQPAAGVTRTGRRPSRVYSGQPVLPAISRHRRCVSVRGVNVSGTPARAELQSGLQLYLKQINETALLSADEEKVLGWAIINDNCPAARERMIRANLRLVVSI